MTVEEDKFQGPVFSAKGSKGKEEKDRMKQQREAAAATTSKDGTGDAAFYTKWSVEASDKLALLVLTILGLVVRCWRLSVPGEVVFDEVHFGKFAGKYLNGTFFYDLHPPLAKMMFAAAGKLSGYDGVFDFKSIGLNYDAAGVPYVGMRLMPAVLGVATIPAAYASVRACGYRAETALLAALLVCFENGLVTQSRLILLDSPLVFFTAMTLTAWSMFWTQQGAPFTPKWWGWLTATGLMMGCAASCKWVGLFLLPTIGLSTIADLWDKVADRSISPSRWGAHFAARAWGLIAVPFAVYLFWFQVHFALLSKVGEGASMMTQEFQASLEGGRNVLTDRDVYYGSEIRLRHTNTQSGYLHSHTHTWQHSKGSGQQQVTIYSYADPNNVWIVEPAWNSTIDLSGGLREIKAGEVIRLKHKLTGKYLHSHDKRPALTSEDSKFEVSGYGFDGFAGDANDNFRVDVLYADKGHPDAMTRVQAIHTKFRITHALLGCSLYNSRNKLPEWAFGQIEVSCMRNSMPPMTTWHIESAHHPAAPADAPKAKYEALGLWGKFWEYNKHMAESNENLTGDHPFAARPQAWPWLRRGTAYWGGKGSVIYQLGNPFVWWGSLAAVLAYFPLRALLLLLDKRRIHVPLAGQRQKYLSAAGFFTVAWLCHYLPFYLMKRELFIHHYFPAVWIATLVLALTLDLLTSRSSRIIRLSVYAAVLAAVLYAFQTFSYITYARIWSKDMCLRSRWLSTWDFDCEHGIGGARATDPPPPKDDESPVHRDSEGNVVVVKEIVVPAENVADVPAENVANAPAENVANVPAENVANVPAENVANVPDAKDPNAVHEYVEPEFVQQAQAGEDGPAKEELGGLDAEPTVDDRDLYESA